MSKTGMALLGKLIMTTIFAAIAFKLVEINEWSWIIAVGVVGTVLNYLLGDLMVLPAFGNIVASIADGILAALTAYVIAYIWPAFEVSVNSLVLFGVLVMVGEYFFHRYLRESEKVEP